MSSSKQTTGDKTAATANGASAGPDFIAAALPRFVHANGHHSGPLLIAQHHGDETGESSNTNKGKGKEACPMDIIEPGTPWVSIFGGTGNRKTAVTNTHIPAIFFGIPNPTATSAPAGHSSLSFTGEEEEPEGRFGPMLTHDGSLAGPDTPRKDFRSHREYIIFCETGPQVKFRFGRRSPDGNYIVELEYNVSVKLLTDFSAPLKAALGRHWRESLEYTMDRDFCDPGLFMRLIIHLKAGGCVINPIKGLEYTDNDIAEDIDVYRLADMYMMDDALPWILEALQRQIADLVGVWMREQADVDATGRADLQRTATFMEWEMNRIEDLDKAFRILLLCPQNSRPFHPAYLAGAIATACPPGVLMQMLDDLSPELALELLRHQLVISQ